MKAFFITVGVVCAVAIAFIAAHEKIADSIYQKLEETEGPYPSEEFDDMKYEHPEQFAEYHRPYLEKRHMISRYLHLFGLDVKVYDMQQKMLEMYEDTPLADEQLYKKVQLERFLTMEKLNLVREGFAQIKQFIEDNPKHPYYEELAESYQRFRTRMVLR